MKQSQLFTKTRREAPTGEVSKNAQLLIRAGFVHKEMAGAYSYLPLGLRVFNNISEIIREEMNAIGGQEILMAALQDAEIWKKTDRWDDKKVDVWFKTKLQTGGEIGLGWTHEEVITAIMREFISSYRDLPLYAYQLQTKFRNEVRAKSGIMRTREFVMKDLYSFTRSEEELDEFYEKCAQAYERIFARTGIGGGTYKTFASGGAFSTYSHEFQTVSQAGEDTIYVHEGKRIAVNKEVLTDEVLQDLGITREELVEKTSIEVGNIFKLGTRFSEPLGLLYTDEMGNQRPVVMGSYGIGPGRVMGTIAEVLSDAKGIIWPDEVAPFRVHLLRLTEGTEVAEAAEELYEAFQRAGTEVLFDDRGWVSAGEKLADADLIGIPFRVIVSIKTIAEGRAEIKRRDEKEPIMVTLPNVVSYIKNYPQGGNS